MATQPLTGLQQQNLSPQNGGTGTSPLAPTQGGGLFAPVQSFFGTLGGIYNNAMQGNNPNYSPAPAPVPTATSNSVNPSNSAWSSQAVTQHPAAQGTTLSPYQQNLANYGISSIPAGYQFDAGGKLVNNAGQEYTSPSSGASAPTNSNSGAATGGGTPFQGNYIFGPNGNVIGTSPATNPENGATNPNPAGNNGAATPANPAALTGQQTANTVSNLNNIASQGSEGDPAEQALQNQIQALQNNYGEQLGNVTGSEMPEAFETGAANVLTQQYQPQLAALTNQLASLQANRTASIGAAESAGGISNTLQGLQQQNQAISPGQSLYNLYSGSQTGNVQPLGQVLNPAQSLVSPFSGNTLATGGGTAGVDSLAQQVASGQMSYQQAQSSLADSAQSPQLQQAISAINPNFNFQQSATNANIQGQIAPAAQNATAQIQNLGNALQNAPALVKTAIPVLNSLATILSSKTGIGGGGATALESARQDAIGAVTGALESANGMTPTAAGSLADSYFPPGLTEAQFQAGLTQFQNQITGKENAFSNPGAVSQTAGQGGNSFQVGGQTIVQNPTTGQWEVQ